MPTPASPKPKTDAEKLAEATALIVAGAELEKEARRPSAQAAADLLTGAEGLAFLNALKSAATANVDDLTTPIGQRGGEGTKQMLERLVTQIEGASAGVVARLSTLQPSVPVPAPAED